jgi:hypothetical protein
MGSCPPTSVIGDLGNIHQSDQPTQSTTIAQSGPSGPVAFQGDPV